MSAEIPVPAVEHGYNPASDKAPLFATKPLELDPVESALPLESGLKTLDSKAGGMNCPNPPPLAVADEFWATPLSSGCNVATPGKLAVLNMFCPYADDVCVDGFVCDCSRASNCNCGLVGWWTI